MDLSGVGSQHWKQNSKFIGLFDNLFDFDENGGYCAFVEPLFVVVLILELQGESHAYVRKKWQRVAGGRSPPHRWQAFSAVWNYRHFKMVVII
jgi:hypothetical protein